jgi:hypothetical protein
VDTLDLVSQSAYVEIKSNPGPSGEDADVSVNLAMSDHLFRAKAHGSADVRARSIHLPDLLDLSSFDASVAQL